MDNAKLIESCYTHKHQGDVLLAGYRLELAVGLLSCIVNPGDKPAPTNTEVKDFLALDTEPLTLAQSEGDGPHDVA